MFYKTRPCVRSRLSLLPSKLNYLDCIKHTLIMLEILRMILRGGHFTDLSKVAAHLETNAAMHMEMQSCASCHLKGSRFLSEELVWSKKMVVSLSLAPLEEATWMAAPEVKRSQGWPAHKPQEKTPETSVILFLSASSLDHGIHHDEALYQGDPRSLAILLCLKPYCCKARCLIHTSNRNLDKDIKLQHKLCLQASRCPGLSTPCLLPLSYARRQ